MSNLPTDKNVMMVSEVANVLMVTTRTINRYVSKLFPELVTHGNMTWLTESQVTQIKLDLEKNKHLDTSVTLPKTKLEKTLLVQQALNILNEEVEELKSKVENQQLQIEEQKPKVESFEALMDTEELTDMGQTAKILGTGRNRLFALLREKNILMHDNIPYQTYQNRGYFEVRKAVKNDQNYSVTFVTPKGVDYIRGYL